LSKSTLRHDTKFLARTNELDSQLTVGVGAQAGPKLTAGADTQLAVGADALAGPKLTAGAAAGSDTQLTAGAEADLDLRLTAGEEGGVGPEEAPGADEETGAREMPGAGTTANYTNSPPVAAASQVRRASTPAWQGEPVAQWHRSRHPRNSSSRDHRAALALTWPSKDLQPSSALPSRPTLYGSPRCYR